jgi:hypothetical protein
MSDRTIKILWTFSIFWMIICFWLSCGNKKHYELVVITEDLLCEISSLFDSVRINPDRACSQHYQIEYYRFSKENCSFSKYGQCDYPIGMKSRYKPSFSMREEAKKPAYRLFKDYLKSMEYYGIKCVYCIPALYERLKDTIKYEMPCEYACHITFYTDRLDLRNFKAYDDRNLAQYESIEFILFPIYRDTVGSQLRFLKNSLWVYEPHNIIKENN